MQSIHKNIVDIPYTVVEWCMLMYVATMENDGTTNQANIIWAEVKNVILNKSKISLKSYYLH